MYIPTRHIYTTQTHINCITIYTYILYIYIDICTYIHITYTYTYIIHNYYLFNKTLLRKLDIK